MTFGAPHLVTLFLRLTHPRESLGTWRCDPSVRGTVGSTTILLWEVSVRQLSLARWFSLFPFSFFLEKVV